MNISNLQSVGKGACLPAFGQKIKADADGRKRGHSSRSLPSAMCWVKKGEEGKSFNLRKLHN